jgi:YD repeat-containing protein
MGRWRGSGLLGTRALALLASAAFIVGGLAAAPAGTAAAAQDGRRPAVTLGPASRGAGTLAPRPGRPAVFTAAVPAGTTWPAPGTAVAAAVPARPAPALPGSAVPAPLWALPSLSLGSQAGRLPLSAAATDGAAVRGVRFTVAPHAAALAAGIRGLLFTAAAVDGAGKVRVGVDYARFASAYGGGFGASLGLAELPACALITPRIAACDKITRIRSVNDTTAQAVSATVSLPAAAGQGVSAAASPATAGKAVVLAALAAPQDGGGATGNYQATKLTPASTWSAGGSSGDFTYSYPITVPPAPGGLVPGLTLGYDSGTADGQTAQDQPQASWLGEGWSLPQAFITQSFTPCADNPEGSAAPAATQDACYSGPVLNLTLNGQSTPLVCPSPFSYTAASTCHAADDSGAVITHHVGSGNGQASKFTDYWTVTTRDGTTYYFGLNHLPGWASGDLTTSSADWEPVFSAHSGDPCYHVTAATFAGSVCNMAYQWNLDYVTNSFGSAMAYFYTEDTNAYDEYGQSTAQRYVRDTRLSKILYGFTDGNAYSTAVASAPADEIAFATGNRCFAGTSSCSPLNATTAPNWLDVPYNLICSAGSACTSASGYGPTFFSTVALTSVTAYQRTGTATAPSTPVDQWTFSQGFPALPNGDTADVPTLTLNSITRTAEDATSGATAGSAVTFPAESFSYTMLQNQLDPGTAPWMSRPRLLQVTTETGSQIKVSYTEPAPCPVSNAPVAPSANNLSCFPVYWGLFQPDTTGGDYGYPDWFIKYAVQSVQQTDPSGGSPGLYAAYHYAAPAWHYDDNEVVEAKERTYGQWRGYQKVYTIAGSGSDPQTETETDYYQGMSDDNNTTAVSVADSQGAAHDDANQLAGNTLETTAYDYAAAWPAVPPQSAVDHSSIYSYWVSAALASRTRSGLPALTASATGVTEQWNRQAITDGGTTAWRDTATDTTYYADAGDPAYGLPEFVYSLGDLSHLGNPSGETCSFTDYTWNTGKNIVLPAETGVGGLPCGGTNTGTASAPPSGAVNALAFPSGITDANTISDTRTFYDDPSLATTWPQPASASIAWPQAAPGNTEVSVVQEATTTADSGSYQTTSARTYNSYGQVTASYDGNGGYKAGAGTYTPTATSYTLADGSDTSQTVTNPLGQATTTSYDPARGLPVTTTDPNGITTTLQYDQAGRLTSRWDNGRTVTDVPSYAYSYAF